MSELDGLPWPVRLRWWRRATVAGAIILTAVLVDLLAPPAPPPPTRAADPRFFVPGAVRADQGSRPVVKTRPS
ncbi:MAG: hypothetical protein ACYDGR_02790 [Candidatus Dormibacteria bacterium]